MAMKSGEPSWRWRRGATFVVSAYCLWQVTGMKNALDSELNRLIATGLLLLPGMLLAVYTSFATVQDVIAIWRTGRALPYAPPSDSANDGRNEK